MKRAYQGLIVWLVAGICTGMNMAEDHCLEDKHKILKEFFRSTGYDLRATDTEHCDIDMRDGWYRFLDHVDNTSITMPTVCPGTNTCGTKYAFWLNGSHPTEEGPIQMNLCAKTNDNPNGSCCDITKNVFVLKCNGFYIYYLIPERKCPSGFCAGTRKRCPVGMWSKTDMVPCRDRFPILKTPPEINGPLVNGNQDFEFVCRIVYDQNEADQMFEVSWTFDGKPDPNINNMILAGTERETSLNAQQLQNHFDQQVECQVRTYYEGREHDKSQLTSSKPVFFGIEEQPELLGPNLDQKGTTFDFQCRVPFSTHDPDQRIEVFWTFNGRTDDAIKSETLTGKTRSVSLDGVALSNHQNQNIGCQARLIFANKITTSFRKSKNYYFGITVSPLNVTIGTTDNEKEVTVTSTIPVICDEGQNCCVTFTAKINTKGVVSVKDTCEHRICSADWDQQKKSASVKISLVPFRNEITAGIKTAAVSIDILAAGTGRYISIFSKHKLPSVSVEVTIKGGYSCSLTGDPHLTGFDYKHTYHFYTVGDYTAYTVDDRDFTVQVRTWPCWAVTCVCGLIVKEQHNVIRVYGCDRPGNLLASTVSIPYTLTEGASVMRSQNGHHIGITLPSGSHVKIDIDHWYMNVYINTPAFDINKARGLCGTNDGDQNNDFTHPDGTVTPVCSSPGYCIPTPFINSWTVTGDRSLFVRVPPQPKIATASKYCYCAQALNTCTSGQHSGQTKSVCNGCHVITNMLRPDPWGVIAPVVVNSDKQWSSDYDIYEDEHSNERSRRSSDQEMMYSDQAAKDVDPNKQWPNSNGVTESQAIDMCNKSISSAQLFNQCEYDNTMVTNVMNDCLSDILYGDTTETVDTMKSSFTTQCQQAMAKDEKNYQQVDGVAVMKEVFLDFVCPLECMTHGNCGPNGTCLCQSGWEGDTCHIQAGKGPQISWTNKGSLCYAKQKMCDSVNLMVSNVNILDELKCLVHTLDNRDKKSGTPVISAAIREGSPEAKCSLPQTGSSTLNFTISVTKDEKLFSNEMRINTFDSTCLSCTDTGCVELKTACHINNVCYANGEHNKNNVGLICDVSKHTSAWSVVPSNSGRTTTDTLALVLIVLFTFNTLS